ncbi:MAG: glycosyltransferase [Pseudanabaenaceae cyanobacterium bins.68]|nr:glycosyltransferase [Pseudanabaenaceae cyanobacterium bins.68]
MSYPLVSVCVPTYNGERFIDATLQSILAQDYRPLEVIIGDDGSGDQTVQICAAFQAAVTDPEVTVKILPHDRLGLAGNWNFCMANSSGEYLKFVFQDDLLLPDCISDLVSVARKDHEIGLVFCQRQVICEDDLQVDQIYIHLHHHWQKLRPVQSGLELLLDPNLLEPPLNKIGEPSNVLLSARAIAQVGDFDQGLVQVLDWDMWLRFLAVGKIGYVDRVLVQFRVHQGQVSQHNAESGASWLDNWRLYLKMLSDRAYEFLPEGVRQDVFIKLVKELQAIQQQIKGLNQQIDLLHTDRQMIAHQLEQTQTQFQQQSSRDQALQADLQHQLTQAHQAHSQEVHRLTQTIDQMGSKLQETHQDLKEIGEEMTALHRQYLAKQQEQIETQTALEAMAENWQVACAQIREMEQSKFWQLRNFWFGMKRRLGWK